MTLDCSFSPAHAMTLWDQTPLASALAWIIPSSSVPSRFRCLSIDRHDGSHIPAQPGILLIQLDGDFISYVT